MKNPEMLKLVPDHLNPNKAGLFEGSFFRGQIDWVQGKEMLKSSVIC